MTDSHGDSCTTEVASILNKAFDLLYAFNDNSRVMTLSELARASGLPKSTVHRLLARLVDLGALGRPASKPVLLDLPTPAADGDALTGAVLRADRFGNVITNIDRRTFDAFVHGRSFTIEIGGAPVARLVGAYAEIGEAEVCALFGSADLLELAARSARASDRLTASPGSQVRVARQ